MSGWRRIAVPLLWTGLLVPWTWGLLVPIPENAGRVGGMDMSVVISKTLHGGVYTVLAMLTLGLPFSSRSRIALLGFVIAHGGATEFLQQFVQRHSSWWDFGLDTASVLTGAALALLWHQFFDLGPVAPQVVPKGNPGA